MEPVLTQRDLWAIRGMTQRAGWGEFMGHLTQIMAEQAGNTQGEQSNSLSQCASAFACLVDVFAKCGKFDYSKFRDAIPEDVRDLIDEGKDVEQKHEHAADVELPPRDGAAVGDGRLGNEQQEAVPVVPRGDEAP
jgi:hypothetical protein